MNAFSLELHGFAGSSIEDCCKEAVRLAEKLGIGITFNFNGVKCFAFEGDDPDLIVRDWHRALSSQSKYKLATAKPLAVTSTLEGEQTKRGTAVPQ